MVPLNHADQYLYIANSKYSLLGRRKLISTAEPSRLTETAANLDIMTFAFADSETFYSYSRFTEASRASGIKPIPGVVLPTVFPFRLEAFPTTFLARNSRGLTTLFAWSTHVRANGGVITENHLTRASQEGVITLLNTRTPDAERYLDSTTRDSIFFTVDEPHPASLDRLRKLQAPHHGLIAHRITLAGPEQQPAAQWLAQAYAKNSYPQDRSRTDFSCFPRPEYLAHAYSEYMPALNRGRDILESVEIQPTPRTHIRAKSVPPGLDSFTYLKQMALQSAYATDPQQRDLLNKELGYIHHLGSSDYILMSLEMADYCRDNQIPFAISGSGNNSPTLQALGLVEIDGHGLLQERFINPHRTSNPDIDFMFPAEKQPLVFDFMQHRYPEAQHFVNINHMRAGELRRLVRKSGVPITVGLFNQIVELDLPHHVSRHSSGLTFATDVPFDVSSQQGIPTRIIQEDKHAVETVNSRSIYDLLISYPMSHIYDTQQSLSSHGIPTQIPDNSQPAIARLYSGNTLGIGNVESPHMMQVLRNQTRLPNFRPSLDRVAQALAVARPAAGARQAYFNYSDSVDHPFTRHQELVKILGVTNYALIYQEQILRLATEAAGYDFQQADKLRKLMSEDVPLQERQLHLRHLAQDLSKQGYSKQVTDLLTNQISQFVSYGFPEGHSRSLARIAYQQAYLAEVHPWHYAAALLKHLGDTKNLTYEQQAYINLIHRSALPLYLPPLDQLPRLPHVTEQGITPGLINFHKRPRHFPTQYSRLTNMLHQDAPLDQIIRHQLQAFGVVFTHHSLAEFSPDLDFNPQLNRQTIIGQLVCQRVHGVKGKERVFATLDNPVSLIHGTIYLNALKIHGRHLLHNNKPIPNSIWHVDINRNQEFPDSWHISGIHPTPTSTP